MAFDKDIFLANFLEQAATGIEQKRAEAAKYKEQQEAAAQRNAQIVQQRQARAGQAAQLGKRAMALGATEAQVRTAMASGVTGVSELYEKLNTAAQQKGVAKLGIDDIEAIVNMPSIPAVNINLQDMSLEDYAKKTYGAMGTAAPVKDDTSFMRGLFGLDAKTRVKQQLADTEYAGGMSIADINAAASNAEYLSLFPEATMTFKDVKYFGTDEAFEFSKQMSKVASDAVDTDSAKAYIKAARRAGSTPEEAAANEKAAIEELQQKALKPYIEYYADTYNEGGFFNNRLAMRQVEALAGTDYLKTLKTQYGIIESDESPVVDEDGMPEATPVVETKPEPTKVTLEKKPDTDAKADTEFPAAPELDEEGKAIVEDALSSKGILRENKYTDKYTKAQWEKMSRKQRRERNLPETPLGGMNFYFREDIDELIEAPLKNLNIKRNLDKPTYKVKIKGRGTYHVTAEQLDSINDSYFRGSSPAIEIMEYNEGEKKAKNITSNILKQLGS